MQKLPPKIWKFVYHVDIIIAIKNSAETIFYISCYRGKCNLRRRCEIIIHFISSSNCSTRYYRYYNNSCNLVFLKKHRKPGGHRSLLHICSSKKFIIFTEPNFFLQVYLCAECCEFNFTRKCERIRSLYINSFLCSFGTYNRHIA